MIKVIKNGLYLPPNGGHQKEITIVNSMIEIGLYKPPNGGHIKQR